ncbi:MAG: LysR family transcriptional regulator [Rhizobiales bacterium]|nr:LysR family transcriptional regulator [Hyphomicrobiales bacterium]
MGPRSLHPAKRFEIRDLELFLAVAETGSFRKAAIGLRTGQPSVSRRIRKLEDVLGVSLFERRCSGAHLTIAGWAFAERARSVVSSIEAAVGVALESGNGRNGRLHVGMIASLSSGTLRRLVTEFRTAHPGVEMRFSEYGSSELLTLLNHRLLDVAFVSGTFREACQDSLLMVEEQIYLALDESDPLAMKVRLSWDDVRSARFLVSEDESGPEVHEYLMRRLADLGSRPEVVRHRLGREGIMNLVGLGFGVGLVAGDWCGVSYPGVVFRRVGDDGERVQFSLVWRPENDNPALRRFLSLARIDAKRNGALSRTS